jgi:hypothetical protein
VRAGEVVLIMGAASSFAENTGAEQLFNTHVFH